MMSTVSEKLLQVAQNNPKVYHSGQLDIVKNAECLKGSKSSSAMLLDDISPVTHEMGVKVRSKNLIPYPYYDNFTELHGVTYTINSDGSVTASGVITKGTNFVFCMGITLKAGTYTLSGVSNFSGMILKVYDNTEKIQLARVALPQTSVTFTITQDYNNVQVYINQAAVGTEVSGTVYPQLELSTTATDYTPYVSDLTAVKVTRSGKNLFSLANRTWANFGANDPTAVRNISKDNFYFKITANNYAVNSTTNYEIIDGNSIKITTTNAYGLGVPFHLIVGQQYAISCIKSDNTKCRINIGYYDIEGNYLSTIYQASTFTMPENAYWAMVCFVANTTETSEELTFSNVQLELGSTATDYEPYITPTEYTPTADGTVNGVTSLYPNTTLTTDADGVLIDCEYYKDIDKTFNELTTSVALSGGDS